MANIITSTLPHLADSLAPLPCLATRDGLFALTPDRTHIAIHLYENLPGVWRFSVGSGYIAPPRRTAIRRRWGLTGLPAASHVAFKVTCVWEELPCLAEWVGGRVLHDVGLQAWIPAMPTQLDYPVMLTHDYIRSFAASVKIARYVASANTPTDLVASANTPAANFASAGPPPDISSDTASVLSQSRIVSSVPTQP